MREARRTAGLASLLMPLPNRRRKSDDIAAQIRGLVARGRLICGEKLPPERELAALMEASRGAIREGLRRLEQTGLVEQRPGRHGGSFIARPSLIGLVVGLRDQLYLAGIEMAEFNDARIQLECLIVRLATQRAMLGDWNALQSELRFSERIWKAGTWHERSDVQCEFHMKLARASWCPPLEVMLEALLRLSLEFSAGRNANRPRETVRFRRKLLRLMQAGDGEGAAAAMADYLALQQSRYRDIAAEAASRLPPEAQMPVPPQPPT